MLLPGQAQAQSNFESSLPGGRTAMMGGAAVALGADEATAFMNPAGITRIPGQSFSFSTFALQVGNRTVNGALDPEQRLGVADASVGQTQLRIIPNSFCLFLNGPPKDKYSRRSRHKYAMCAAATERERLDFSQNRIDSGFGERAISGVGHSTRMDFVRSTLALAWGLELGASTSLGVTWRVDNSRFQDSTIATAYAAEDAVGRMQGIDLARNAWSWDTSLVLGVTSSISRTVTLGASFSTPSQHIFGSYTGVGTVSSSDGETRLIQDVGDFRYNTPASLRLGLGFTWPRLTVEVNGSFYGPQSQRARANFDRTETAFSIDASSAHDTVRDSVQERGRPITNVAAGAEFFLERDFSIVSGVQTDFSGIYARQDSLIEDVLFRQNKDTILAALGVSSYGSLGRLLIGVRGTYSWGEALIADPSADVPHFVALSQHDWTLTLILSGRISFRAVRDTAVRVATPLKDAMDNADEELE